MKGKILCRLILFIIIGLIVVGCENRRQAAEKGNVKANPGYLEHFGPPPTPETGTCFARVGFFPSTTDPGKVRAVPYFLFRETGQLEQILRRMVSEQDVFPTGADMATLFPPGTEVSLSSVTDGLVEVNLLTPENGTATLDLQAAALALTETAVQFEEIERVRIFLNGEPLPDMPSDGFRHQPDHISPAGPAVLLTVIGTWEEGAEGPEEILVGFDRPVTVEAFQLLDALGQPVKGEYYRSAFDMAVVIHPASPHEFTEGMTLRAEWDVTDALGRKGKGAGDFALVRHDH
jgi:hypothetical protein